MLFEYMQQTQRLVADTAQKKIAPNDLIYYINRARRHTAEITQCVRYLTPISGSITSLTIIGGGSGYTSPTITISTPDLPSGSYPDPSGLQATATSTLTTGTITSLTIINPGSGYYAPSVSISDSTGTGASITAITSSVTTLIQGQEVYNFSTFPITQAGIGSIYAVRSVAIIFDNYRYVLPHYSFSTYQAFVRQYPNQYLYVPTVFSQYGQGAAGSLYMYPLPSQSYSFQCDCQAIPSDLLSDTDTEVIPQPWQDPISYWAAYLAKLELQDMNGAREMMSLYKEIMIQHSNAARIGGRSNMYGRWAWLLPIGLSLLHFLGQVT